MILHNIIISIRTYYSLTKPNMVYGNALVAAAGYLYGAAGDVDWILFVQVIAGASLVIASACVFNNIYDQEIDSKMERTKTRALVSGEASTLYALIFASVLALAGFGLLLPVSLLATAVALLGFVAYGFYTPLKHITPYSLFVGAVAGATPPVIGYVATGHTFDTTAIAFFLFLFFWQIPHFLAISVYRYSEYTAAGVPLFITHASTEQGRWVARNVFYLTLVILLVWCAVLMVHR